MRNPGTALLVSLAALAAGCGGFAGERSQIHLRWLEEAPRELYDPDLRLLQEPLFAWNLDDPDEASRWIPEGDARPPAPDRDGGLPLRPDGERSVIRRVAFDASTVTTIELTVAEPPQGTRFVLSWAGPGEGFSIRRSLGGRYREARRGPRARVRFEVGDGPLWRGAIRRLRLTVAPPAGTDRAEVRLWGVAGFFRTPSPARLAAILERSWQVDLAGDVRDALPAVPGTVLERELEVPAGARLRFAYGAPELPRQPVELRVEAGSETVPERTLFSARIPPGAGDGPGWRQAAVDLAPLAGKTVRLRLRTLAVGPAPEASGPVPIFWGHPEVLRPRTGPAPPNVLLISIDTLRADHLSMYGYPRETSPRLDAWARRHATVFLDAVAQAPWTLPSHVSMLTGLDAHRHGVSHDGPVPASVELLAERLRAAGYTTLAVTGGAWLHPRYGFSRGFDRYVYWRGWAKPERRDEELADGLERALAAVEEHRDRPFFLFFHTYEVHAPYLPREPYFTRLGGPDPPRVVRVEQIEPSPEDGFLNHQRFRFEDAGPGAQEAPPESQRDLLRSLYDSGIAYTDAQVHRLLEHAERLAPPSGSVVVLTSDHGEMLGEHGLAAHEYLREETLLVPLVVQAPDGRGAGLRVGTQVRSVDIVPTLLELAGLPAAAGIDGRSLVGLMTAPGADPRTWPEEAWSYASKSNRGISLRLGGRLKYVLNPTAWAAIPERERLHDLRRDPGEEVNLVPATDPADLRRRALGALAAAPGLRLRLVNHGPESLSGLLRGPAIDPLRVEQLGPACSCVTWEGEERAAFTVAPDRALDLLIEEADARELSLTLRSPGREPFTARVSLPDLRRARVVGRTEGGAWGWVEGGGDALPASVTLWWQGEPSAGSAAGPPEDEALAEELRALGYL